jgi:hypothetical protein
MLVVNVEVLKLTPTYDPNSFFKYLKVGRPKDACPPYYAPGADRSGEP